jgi:hypothetical protein
MWALAGALSGAARQVEVGGGRAGIGGRPMGRVKGLDGAGR